MDPVFKIPPTPGLSLFPVSPERSNRQYFPQSPSLPSDLASCHRDPSVSSHSRTSSDVQGKVAQFNNLSKEAIQRRKENEAALRRAVVGREEAEGETRRLKEENKALRKELDEGRTRERRVGERVEAVMVRGRFTLGKGQSDMVIIRKRCNDSKKHDFTPRRSMKKKSEELAKRPSNHRVR